MFEVAFKAVSILGSMPIDNNKLRRYYEQIIKAFVRSELNYLNLEKLSAIIVPDVFIDEVLEFQKEIGISNPNVTNTTLARAFEKMIHDTKEDKSSVIDHSEEYINGIENEIMKQRKNYNYNRIELNNFCQIFHKFTKMYLIHIVSELGIAKELGRTVSYGGFKIEKYLPVLEAELDRMYKTAYCENRVVVSEVLIDLLFEYYAEFRIFITETRQGVRYDIPI